MARSDTIAALATPPGRGGVAVVRVSGSLVQTIIPAILGQALTPRKASYLPFLDSNNDVIDEGIALFFPNPHSFTGEDVLELQGHGGPVVVDLILQRILSLGVRIAMPGEFSERAFLNGKMDLAQAEAVSDLINASSKQAARSAMRSLQGDFSREIEALSEHIVYLRMYVEAAIDFTDEEIDFLGDEKVKGRLEFIWRELGAIQKKATQGCFLREGITVVIVGAPNVGKSSLLNCLSGREAAIVTEIPGTTRDVIREGILIDGMPVNVIDTAGLRVSSDLVEREGIRRAYLEVERADLVLLVAEAAEAAAGEESFHFVDGTAPAIGRHIHVPDGLQNENSPPPLTLLPPLLEQRSVVYVRNKVDLIGKMPSVEVGEDGRRSVWLSAKSGEGVELLREAIKSLVGFESHTDGIYLARRRHLDALSRAEAFVGDAMTQLTMRSGELAAEDLRLAHLALCEITGEFSADDLLGKIFSSFCIGK